MRHRTNHHEKQQQQTSYRARSQKNLTLQRKKKQLLQTIGIEFSQRSTISDSTNKIGGKITPPGICNNKLNLQSTQTKLPREPLKLYKGEIYRKLRCEQVNWSRFCHCKMWNEEDELLWSFLDGRWNTEAEAVFQGRGTAFAVGDRHFLPFLLFFFKLLLFFLSLFFLYFWKLR